MDTKQTSYSSYNLKNRPLQFKRATKRAFEKANILLLDGQPAFELDTGKLKIGNGTSRYLNLPYIAGGSGDGKSAYDIWIGQGHQGTIDDFLNSLIGKSAYDVWLDNGNTGTQTDYLNSLKGESAFDQWKSEIGSEDSTFEDFMMYLKTTSWGEF